jgi:tetratricopeptide (TPR) repeat protein
VPIGRPRLPQARSHAHYRCLLVSAHRKETHWDDRRAPIAAGKRGEHPADDHLQQKDRHPYRHRHPSSRRLGSKGMNTPLRARIPRVVDLPLQMNREDRENKARTKLTPRALKLLAALAVLVALGALGLMLNTSSSEVLSAASAQAEHGNASISQKERSSPGSSKPASSTTAAPSGVPSTGPTDSARIAALITEVTARPKDTVSLLAIGDIYFAAGDYRSAAAWERRVVAVDPKSRVGLVSYGAAEFNLSNDAAAKKSWILAEKLYPNVAEIHYDLGFLYMSQSPPDTANMTAEWKKVIAIDPGSTLAEAVKSDLSSN